MSHKCNNSVCKIRSVFHFWHKDVWICAHLTGERSGFNAWTQEPEMTLGIVVRKRQKSTGDDESTLVLKTMGRITRSAKQRVPVVPQNGHRSTKK